MSRDGSICRRRNEDVCRNAAYVCSPHDNEGTNFSPSNRNSRKGNDTLGICNRGDIEGASYWSQRSINTVTNAPNAVARATNDPKSRYDVGSPAASSWNAPRNTIGGRVTNARIGGGWNEKDARSGAGGGT